jgi:multiple sugar transport system ATP-binding protein
MIYVTHDQIEAMSMGDRIVVMKDGVVQQVDTPLNLYHHPTNRFVAGFIGSPTMNFFTGSIHVNGVVRFQEEGSSFILPLPPTTPHLRHLTNGKRVVLGIRPEHISQTAGPKAGDFSPNPVMIEVVEPVGNEVFVYFSTGSGQNFVARVASDNPPVVQATCDLLFDTSRVHLFDAETGGVLEGK